MHARKEPDTVSTLIDIFLQPAKAFADLKERPTVLVPYLTAAVLAAVFSVAYFTSVDAEWYTNHALAASGQEMTQKELEQARKFIPGAQTMAWITGITSFVVLGLMLAISGVYYLLTAKLTGNDMRFRKGLSLAAWSNMPGAIASIVALIGVFGMDPQTPLESLMMLNVDPLFVELPRDHAWSSLAKAFSLTTLWTIFLAALGWKTWNRTGWGQAILVAIVPQAAFLGFIALLS